MMQAACRAAVARGIRPACQSLPSLGQAAAKRSKGLCFSFRPPANSGRRRHHAL